MMYFNTGPTEWFGHHAVWAFDMRSALEGLRAPTLILSNTGDVSHEKTQRARKLRDDFSYHELEGGTVYIVYEEPQRWIAPVIDFASKVFARARDAPATVTEGLEGFTRPPSSSGKLAWLLRLRLLVPAIAAAMLPDSGDKLYNALGDIEHLALGGGSERSEAEHSALFEHAGLEAGRVIRQNEFAAAIEGVQRNRG